MIRSRDIDKGAATAVAAASATIVNVVEDPIVRNYV